MSPVFASGLFTTSTTFGFNQFQTKVPQLRICSWSKAYIQNLEKWYRRTYLQGSNGETDIANRIMDMGRGEERVGRMERVTWKLTLAYVK